MSENGVTKSERQLLPPTKNMNLSSFLELSLALSQDGRWDDNEKSLSISSDSIAGPNVQRDNVPAIEDKDECDVGSIDMRFSFS